MPLFGLANGQRAMLGWQVATVQRLLGTQHLPALISGRLHMPSSFFFLPTVVTPRGQMVLGSRVCVWATWAPNVGRTRRLGKPSGDGHEASALCMKIIPCRRAKSPRPGGRLDGTAEMMGGVVLLRGTQSVGTGTLVRRMTTTTSKGALFFTPTVTVYTKNQNNLLTHWQFEFQNYSEKIGSG